MKFVFILTLIFLSFSLMAENIYEIPERNKKEILITGHRGNNRFAPENTMESYRQAAELGSDYIETDVRLTKDGVLVFQHDEDIERNTNGKGRIQDKTLMELKGYDFGFPGEFQDRYKGEPICTVEEGMKYFKKKNQKVLYEIKTPSVIKPLAELIRKIKPSKKNTCFLVWNNDDAKNLSKELKGYRIFHLWPLDLFKAAENKVEFFDEMKKAGITDFSVNFHQLFNNMTKEETDLFLIMARERKMQVGVWTVDSTGDLNKAMEYQVIGVIKKKNYIGKIDMITTNDPEKALVLAGRK